MTQLEKSELEMMTALVRFKKTHGDDAYCALLRQFNAKRYSEIPATKHGEVVMQCKAGTADLKIVEDEAAEVEADEKPSVADRLNQLAAKAYGGSKANDFAVIAAGAPSVREAMDRMARAANLRG